MSAYTTQTIPYPTTREDRARRAGRLLTGVARATLLRWQRHRMRQALERLDDRILRDIGIHRSDITHVVNGFSPEELRMVPVARSL